VSGAPANISELVAGTRHTCARTTASAVHCWGSNEQGQLGDGTTTDHATPAPISGSLGVVADLAAGNASTCALISSTQRIMCWGANDVGQLGDGTTTRRTSPVNVAGGSGYAALTVGGSHACAKLDSGVVRCWGGNDWGQVGDRTATRFPEAERIAF
jgi:alpha-tubulin suppressor-like RCC1 family protein